MKQKVIDQLKKATSVDHWNAIRAAYVGCLSRAELASIDSSGLIVQVLGRD